MDFLDYSNIVGTAYPADWHFHNLSNLSDRLLAKLNPKWIGSKQLNNYFLSLANYLNSRNSILNKFM